MDRRDLEEIGALRAMLGAKPRPVGWAARRERLDEVGAFWPVAEDIALEPAELGGVPCEWSASPALQRRLLLMFFHGGGYCSGSIRSHRRLVTEAGRAAGLQTLAIDYRRAPEHPFPAALEDAVTAWEAVIAKQFDPSRIAVGGDSAGGGLSVSLVQHLRGAGRALPGALWLVSPWTDLTLSGASLATKAAVDPLIGEPYLAELAEAYLPSGMDRADPRVSPLFANLTGLPPTLIQVGSHETMLDDATRFAAALGAADVAVTLQVWPLMIHAWPVWNAGLDAGRRALTEAGAFLRTHLG